MLIFQYTGNDITILRAELTAVLIHANCLYVGEKWVTVGTGAQLYLNWDQIQAIIHTLLLKSGPAEPQAGGSVSEEVSGFSSGPREEIKSLFPQHH